MRVVEQRLSPEFLNRIDEIILFDRLERQHIAGIVDIMLANVATRRTGGRRHEPLAKEWGTEWAPATSARQSVVAAL